ncbi:Mitogen-activated protein kinase kinase kinase 14 [Dissostichus eleginoides]|uniref:Mitogen-activated protein kinase kinase kinase 14 n=1 Tax=Dissostichus eleginoides TaxID=100907 RepID=A0AAD9BH07_DISEL|nr:Mitogen-activated protein kinase kinase kinase 14 [Dissostichus eleginoides]
MHSDREMAIPRMLNSNTSFIIHGTAKHVVTEEGPGGAEEDLFVSIVAQAEREDFQEFSPSNTQCPYTRAQLLKKHRDTALLTDSEDEDFDGKLPQHHLQRKQRRKARRQSQEDGEEPPIIRGLWVQEIDWLKLASREMMLSSAEIIPPPPQFTDCSHGDSEGFADVCVHGSECVSLSEECYRSADTDDTSSTEGEADSESVYTLESDSSCPAEDGIDSFGVEAKMSNLTFDLMQVSGFNSAHAEWDSDSTMGVQSLLGVSGCTVNTPQCAFGFDDLSDTVLDDLRGRVTLLPKLFVSPLFRDLIKQTVNDWKTSTPVNEGLIFHHQLQPDSCQYREGEEYCVLNHIQNGSYGDVFCVRDKRTGFQCAAKRIPLSHCSGEEVSTWSALNSPRVVELFGAVREGPNIVLFMDLKPACLAQLLKEMNSLPEDLSLHYLHQTLGALEHLHHRKVLHLDVKVDNVLLSADCRDTFLCDFGLSETLDDNGWSTNTFRGAAFPGTETHMAPEVARGDQLCAKADVWSSCCMLLHMLNGCHPWIRYYSHPLCLQIVNEPPPLWEVPSNCNNFTAKVFRAGLQKDSDRRTSAKELRRKTTKALRAGSASLTTLNVFNSWGLSPWSVKIACEKLHHSKSQNEDTPCSLSPDVNPTKASDTMYWVSPWRTTAVDEDSNDWRDGVSDQDSEAETYSLIREWESRPKSLQDDYTADVGDWDSFSDSEVDIYMAEEEYVQEKWLRSQQTNDNSWGSEPELEYLRDDVAIGTTIQIPSPEPRDDPPSCFSCSDTSPMDASEKDSDHSSDDLSSGVFSSCNSQTDGHLEWLASDNQPSSCCFEGVDIWIENVQGECLRIRERRQVKVGHVAIGISDQISGKAFTLETLDRKTVSFEQEIRESCLWLRCVPAPDRCQRWRWRVRYGKLELRE